MLCINENISHQLGLEIVDTRPAILADGSIRDLDIAGPIEIRFENHRTITQAAILPGDSQPLLGSIPMEDMDVIIDAIVKSLNCHSCVCRNLLFMRVMRFLHTQE